MSVNATITVYLQALGGKFLGPHAYMTDEITVTLAYSGGTISLPYALGSMSNDGSISTDFTVGSSSFMPILTAQQSGNPVVNYLTADANTISAQAELVLTNDSETGMLSISVPRPDGAPLVLEQSVLLVQTQTMYNPIIVVPGLLLIPGQGDPDPYSISVFVKMMCGCQVTINMPTSFWSPSDFTVSAEVWYADGSMQVCQLSFDVTTNNSLFHTGVEDYYNIVQVNFTARQSSTGNYGYLSQSFTLQ